MREIDGILRKPCFMHSYNDRLVRILYGIILAQFIVIAILLGGFSSEYFSNVYFRAWVDNNFPQMSLLLTGQFDALFIGMALGGTILLIQRTINLPGIDQSGGKSPTHSPVSTETRELLPSHATKTEKIEVTKETPEQVLGELEKHAF